MAAAACVETYVSWSIYQPEGKLPPHVPNSAFPDPPPASPAEGDRPLSNVAFDGVIVTLCAWFLSGLYLDGWAHQHIARRAYSAICNFANRSVSKAKSPSDPAEIFRNEWSTYKKVLDCNYMFHREIGWPARASPRAAARAFDRFQLD